MTSRTPRRPRSTSAPEERRPGVALVVAGGELEPEDPALAGRRHPDRDEGGHAHDPARLADLDVRRVEQEVRVALVGERAAPEGGDLGVERGADPADLAPAHEAMPRASTRSSTRRVLTPATYASWTTERRARSARRRGSSRLGKYEPSRTLGIARPIVPTRVSQRRSRYPFRFVSRRSGARSPLRRR